MSSRLPLGMSLGLVAVLPGAYALAQNTFEYGVDLSVEDAVVTDRVVNTNADPVNLAINNLPHGTASGRSHVGTGVNKAASTLNLVSSAADPTGIGYANAYAFWYDVVTIDDPVNNGNPGTFTATMLVNGSGDLTASGPWMNLGFFDDLYGVWTAFVGVFIDDTFQEDGWYGYWEVNPVTGQFEYDGAPLGQIQAELTFDFTFGEPFVLSGRLQTYMSVFSQESQEGTFDGELDLGNSAYWGGIPSIRNAAGQTVTGATITSASGVNWASAINPGVTRGDFDGNGITNLDDFNILAAHFGTSVTPWTLGDATGDGVVNLNDFNILASHFGLPNATGTPGPDDWNALASAVPEPAGALSASLMITASALRRRRRCVA